MKQKFGSQFSNSQAEEEQRAAYFFKNQRRRLEAFVERRIPAAVDIVIFAAQVLVFLSFLYMAYFFGMNKSRCQADSRSLVPLDPDSNTRGVDVARRFKMAIRWGFWMSFFNSARAALSQVALYMKKWYLLFASYFLFALQLATLIVLFVLIQIWRWSHTGKVCSGDFIENEEQLPQEEKDKYLLVEGRFILVILVIAYILLSAAIVVFSIYACIAGCKTEETPNGRVRVFTSDIFQENIDSQVAIAHQQRKLSILKKSRQRFEVEELNDV